MIRPLDGDLQTLLGRPFSGGRVQIFGARGVWAVVIGSVQEVLRFALGQQIGDVQGFILK